MGPYFSPRIDSLYIEYPILYPWQGSLSIRSPGYNPLYSLLDPIF